MMDDFGLYPREEPFDPFSVMLFKALQVVAFLFFTWLVPDKQRPDWIPGAKSRVVLQGTGDWLMSLLPDDPENTILKRFKKNKPEDDQTDADQAAPASGDGYSKPARDGLKKLIEKPAGR